MALPPKNLLPILIISALPMPLAMATPYLPLDEYVRQVNGSNPGNAAAKLQAEAGADRRGEGSRAYIPAFTAQYQNLYDKRPTMAPSFQGFKTEGQIYSLGVSQQTPWGMAANITYNVQHVKLFGVSPALVPLPEYYDAYPKLSVTQPLWGNFFGASTRAQIEAADAIATADAATANHGQRERRRAAELTYLHLALARKTVAIRKSAYTRAVTLKDWADRRARMQLGDRSDFLQAEANLKIRELELAAAEDDEKNAAREFNTLRHAEKDTVVEELQDIDVGSALKLAVPKRAGPREDVRAAEARSKAAAAQAIVARESAQPGLEASAFYAMYGRNATRSAAMDRSTGFANPYWGASITLNMPLDFIVQNRLRNARNKERAAADLLYQEASFGSEREWADLTRKHEEYKRQLSLAADLEEAQKEKFTHEKARLDRGRTTTYQVLLFEQDYSAAQLTRLQIQTKYLQNIIDMKLWSAL